MKILKTVLKVLLTLAVTIAGLLLLCLVLVFIMEKGPSETARNIFVHTVRETSRMGFVSRIFLSEETVNEIMNTGGIQELDDDQTNNTELIDTDDIKEEEKQDITFEVIQGTTFKGYVLTIRDPSRVFCGTVPEFGHFDGMTVIDMIAAYNASGDHVIGGVNGGDFVDSGTNNSFTAQPLGAVISEGQVLLAEDGYDEKYHLVGFTNENKLVLGNFTINEALEMGIRDAIYCVHNTGPFLVMDGKTLIEDVPGGKTYGSGKNPRTAIGQKEDGSVILFVCDGRKPGETGATFEDLALFMKDLGAINAAAMDGGTSSQLIYEDEVKNHPYSIVPRKCPTAWLIR
ncbi:MAG: phosphodiester glycosidase family protein [Lachnospiraceae bacterium]|nr:phosphodiester glycosidase family protein [Lachnospiraceae bacterium]